MKAISADALRTAIAAWDHHAAENLTHAEHLLRQPQYFLVTKDRSTTYRAMRFLIGS